MYKRLYFLFAAMLMMVSSAVAQVTTSGMSGKITANGEDVIGATIEAVHTASGTRYVGVTNTKGMYNILGMRSGGPYEVKISYLGYETKIVKGVTLQLGETYNLSTSMNEDAKVLGEVVVTGKGTKLNIEKTGASTNITNQQIMNLPTVTRSITDVTRLSPYGGNGMSFAGADGRTANFTVDGANFNNNFGLSSKLPGGGNPISLDAIEELQVVISPFDVRQTNFIGGGVNAITKSGTNTFKGTAYVYHRNENMRGDAIEGEQIPGAARRIAPLHTDSPSAAPSSRTSSSSSPMPNTPRPRPWQYAGEHPRTVWAMPTATCHTPRWPTWSVCRPTHSRSTDTTPAHTTVFPPMRTTPRFWHA